MIANNYAGIIMNIVSVIANISAVHIYVFTIRENILNRD